ncbi:SDR family NAD(P)-dependent oxidoreductase [Peristeroidobacter agariperforans]|uniref:SDR family NAD(P)-dependent oxidoreductase n=1 Tax=Peristeroidobacter agariperforans TaxID=268404 RepID=UPI00101C76DB|nr:SDR family oxidoreductase [Peristeroidobacter agariperforans]
MKRFDGQLAVVTGAASGIGWAISEQLASGGAHVVLADLNADAAEAKAAQLREAGYHARSAAVDVSAPHDVQRWADDIVAADGTPQILVHSAGVGVERAFLETTIEEWERIIRVDLTGSFLVSQTLARHMIRAGYGRIVLLASTAGLRGGVGRAAYGSAKGGVITLTKVMAVELARYGITVNALAPGAIETELVAVMHSPRTRQTYRSRIPLDRYGTPAETAASAMFLCSREAAYVTGHVLAVDGGFLAAGLMNDA